MPSYVVTGASRGLGYGFVKVLASDPRNTVIGIVRDPIATQTRLAADNISNVHVLAADITDVTTLKQAAEVAKRILGGRGLDVLINNAAYVSEITSLKSLRDFEHDTQVVLEDATKSFEVNVIGVINTVFAFLPLIQEGQTKKVVAISSGMGDIDFINEVKIANAAPYSASKAALSTMFAKLGAAYEDQGILFISLCPGLVDTAEVSPLLSTDDLARLQAFTLKMESYSPGFKASEPSASAESCLSAINRSSLGEGYGGTFLSHAGARRWM